MSSLEDLGRLMASLNEQHQSSHDNKADLNNFYSFAVRFCQMLYPNFFGIKDEKTITELQKVFTELPFLDWQNAVTAAADAVVSDEKLKELERLVPLGVRLSIIYHGEFKDFLEPLVEAYATGFTIDYLLSSQLE